MSGVIKCRWCHKNAVETYCGHCGGRVRGAVMETLPDCLVPQSILDKLTKKADSDSTVWNVDLLAAVRDLNDLVIQASQARLNRQYSTIKISLGRNRADELLSQLAKVPGLVQVRAAVWSLVSDIEQEVRQQEAEKAEAKRLAVYAKLEEKAARLSFGGEGKQAVKAWTDCLFWLSRNEHPRKAELEAAAKESLEAARHSPVASSIEAPVT